VDGAGGEVRAGAGALGGEGHGSAAEHGIGRTHDRIVVVGGSPGVVVAPLREVERFAGEIIAPRVLPVSGGQLGAGRRGKRPAEPGGEPGPAQTGNGGHFQGGFYGVVQRPSREFLAIQPTALAGLAYGRRRRSKASMPRPPSSAAPGSGITVMVTNEVPVASGLKLLPAMLSL